VQSSNRLKAALLERVLELDYGHQGIAGHDVPYGELQLDFLFGGLYHCA
jgi:hypothetical protein